MTGNFFGNKKKGAFLEKIPNTGLGNGEITKKCKFNFSYFDNTQAAGQDFRDWSQDELVKLLEKIKNYSESPLDYWRNQRCGGGGLKILEIYGKFPKKSDFIHPKHVPHDVSWARFRMENLVRLVGFVVPRGFNCDQEVTLTEPFDSNTFYVVFLDKQHKFYNTEDD
ncbi:hypothetical protein H2Y56_12725 [Pectobacterium aroidearum]|uniref:Uncharacterized protein n=1 Tax=Pectobacterium aroidearum TaxID=1201031 RepID=A0ABR5ZEQ6_9GAMM|nr:MULTISPECIES: hypothetical protein [Pectobacterium]MBA5200034.1 hypothetical protein [Pectobacterium aroidearum]MBA5228606.1 hypothetical protein [Pectobacterium aroidearum]MBA5232966.1 hypothetical protein [Pectobacterium aroidearum]MBA5738128.1 hypothetical protein [Pectobacterium aroidearum]UXK01064.1 hypothetical protein N5056_03505 [Pectobacterium aroidearum]